MSKSGIRKQWYSLVPLFLEQIEQCGLFYTLRKYLIVSIRLKFAAHLNVAHSLALPHCRSMLEFQPRTAFKYLNPYLARSFDIRTRSTILSNHYRYLEKQASPDFIDRICSGKITLWQEERDSRCYTIDLICPQNEEGELMLEFCENALPAFTLSFTIAPGETFGLTDEQAIFIGRLQGVPKSEIIGRATKQFHDLTPATLLLNATRAISAALDIRHIVGVSAHDQICLTCESMRARALSVYDSFWVLMGGKQLGNRMYLLQASHEEKPLSEIKPNHRARVKRKRQFKTSLQEQIQMSFGTQCLRPGHRSRHEDSSLESFYAPRLSLLPA